MALTLGLVTIDLRVCKQMFLSDASSFFPKNPFSNARNWTVFLNVLGKRKTKIKLNSIFHATEKRLALSRVLHAFASYAEMVLSISSFNLITLADAFPAFGHWNAHYLRQTDAHALMSVNMSEAHHDDLTIYLYYITYLLFSGHPCAFQFNISLRSRR